MIIESPTPDFLDAYCNVKRYSRLWTLLQVENYGNYAYRINESWATILEKVENLKEWEEDQDVHLVVHGEGRYKVRNICGTKFKIKNSKILNLKFWVNMTVPRNNVVDLRNVRYDAYNNLEIAITDAEEEQKDSTQVVFTKEINTKVDLWNTEKPVVIGELDGMIYETDSVEKIIQENEYLWMVVANILNATGFGPIKQSKIIDCLLKKKISQKDMNKIREQFKELVDKANGV